MNTSTTQAIKLIDLSQADDVATLRKRFFEKLAREEEEERLFVEQCDIRYAFHRQMGSHDYYSDDYEPTYEPYPTLVPNYGDEYDLY